MFKSEIIRLTWGIKRIDREKSRRRKYFNAKIRVFMQKDMKRDFRRVKMLKTVNSPLKLPIKPRSNHQNP